VFTSTERLIGEQSPAMAHASLKGALQIQTRRHEIRNIVVIKLRYIGDTLLITPVLDALNEAFPQASIATVVNRGTEQVLFNNPATDAIIPVDRTASFSKYATGMRLLRNSHFDLAIDLTGADRSAFLVRWSGAPVRMGYRGHSFLRNHLFYNVLVDAEEGALHKVDHHLAMVEAMGLPINGRTPKLYVTDEEMVSTADLLRRKGLYTETPFVVMHPGARRWYKSWPLDFFSQLGDRIVNELHVPIVLAGGGADKDSIQNIQGGMTASCIDVGAQLSLRELACLLKLASLCVVNDSSPMHMAAAVGTPTIALFGLTDPKYWAPRGPDHRVFSHACPCRPYGHRRECPEGDNYCMRKIAVNDVFEAARAMLTRPRIQKGDLTGVLFNDSGRQPAAMGDDFNS
jgi:lipopolysaccharide heptosyltransferase III